MKLLLSRFLLACAAPAIAFAAAASNDATSGSKFELPRLKQHAGPTDAKQISKAHVTADDLSARGKSGVAHARKQEVDYLAIDGGKHWEAPVHGAPDEIAFVSFFLYGSVGTVIDVGGAKLAVRPADNPDNAQLFVGTPATKLTHWRAVGGPIKFEKHGGKLLAPLPVLTLRLDPVGKEWDLFVANRLVSSGLRLADLPKDAPKQFSVSAGNNGAFVCGLVSATENPLYEDANANGIDDAFERQQHGGALLGANATSGDRNALAQQWQQDQRTRNVQPFPVQRPRPDGAPDTPPGKSK